MKAVLVDSKKRTFTDVEFDGNWKTIGPMIGCRLFTVVSGLPGGDDIFIDDEGLLTCDAETTFFKLPWYPSPLAGNGLILGGPDDEGESTDATHDAAYYRSQLKAGFIFMNAESAWLYYNLNGDPGSPFDNGQDKPDYSLLIEEGESND